MVSKEEWNPGGRRRRKKRSSREGIEGTFTQLYQQTQELLGEGSCGKVIKCRHRYTGVEYAVKIISKTSGYFRRSKILNEIELYHVCRGQSSFIQLVEFFEEDDSFLLVFEMVEGGPLLRQIQQRGRFTEKQASRVLKELCEGVLHLHSRGVAHRDLKPENILCVSSQQPFPVKLCDFDLSSSPPLLPLCKTPLLTTPVGSLEYMAPEVVDTFLASAVDISLAYNKKCDLWALGVIAYILLCGYMPFQGHCDNQCGWEEGTSCDLCEEMLMSKIKYSEVNFPQREWASVSAEAKDLVTRLLLKDHRRRPSIEEVLRHPWLVKGGQDESSTFLHTPRNLKRTLNLAEKVSVSIPRKKQAFCFSLSPPKLSNCDLMQRRQNQDKEKIDRTHETRRPQVLEII